MSELGALSSYALAVQNMQMSLIKNQVEMQQQAIEIFLDPSSSVPVSDTLGQNIDISL